MSDEQIYEGYEEAEVDLSTEAQVGEDSEHSSYPFEGDIIEAKFVKEVRFKKPQVVAAFTYLKASGETKTKTWRVCSLPKKKDGEEQKPLPLIPSRDGYGLLPAKGSKGLNVNAQFARLVRHCEVGDVTKDGESPLVPKGTFNNLKKFEGAKFSGKTVYFGKGTFKNEQGKDVEYEKRLDIIEKLELPASGDTSIKPAAEAGVRKVVTEAVKLLMLGPKVFGVVKDEVGVETAAKIMELVKQVDFLKSLDGFVVTDDTIAPA